MSSAALRAAPMARMTVAAPVTMSPPAQTFGTLVRPASVERPDVAPLGALEAAGVLEEGPVGAGADGHDDHVDVDQELGPSIGHRAAAAGVVGLAELHRRQCISRTRPRSSPS